MSTRWWRFVSLVAVLQPSASPAQSLPELRLMRELRIDAVEHDLSPIAFLAVAPSGTMVVAQQQDRNLRYFDVSGKSLGTFGRQGQGPGEFQHVGLLTWIGDTLVVSDRRQYRFTLISPDRKLVRTVPWLTILTVPLPPELHAPSARVVIPELLLGDRSQIVSASMNRLSMAPNVPSRPEEPSPVMRVDSSGAFRRLITRVPSSDDCSVRVEGSPGGYVVTSIPYCFVPLEDVAADGSRYSLAFVEKWKNSYRVEVTRSNGEVAFARSHPYQPVAVPSAVRDSVKAAARAPAPRAAAERIPEFLPPLATILSGRDETTWIELFSIAGDRTWQVLDERGNSSGHVRVPRNVRIKVASRAAVWATETDDDGLQHIVRYRVSR